MLKHHGHSEPCSVLRAGHYPRTGVGVKGGGVLVAISDFIRLSGMLEEPTCMHVHEYRLLGASCLFIFFTSFRLYQGLEWITTHIRK